MGPFLGPLDGCFIGCLGLGLFRRLSRLLCDRLFRNLGRRCFLALLWGALGAGSFLLLHLLGHAIDAPSLKS